MNLPFLGKCTCRKLVFFCPHLLPSVPSAPPSCPRLHAPSHLCTPLFLRRQGMWKGMPTPPFPPPPLLTFSQAPLAPSWRAPHFRAAPPVPPRGVEEGQ